MKHKIILMLIGAVLVAGLVSCGPGAALAPGTAGGSAAPTQSTISSQPASGIPLQTPFADGASEAVMLARKDLAQRLGVPVEGVSVAAVIGQEFSVEAFYCRTMKDRSPKQEPPVAMTGFVILLRASAGRYEYHASGPTVVFCRPLP